MVFDSKSITQVEKIDHYLKQKIPFWQEKSQDPLTPLPYARLLAREMRILANTYSGIDFGWVETIIRRFRPEAPAYLIAMYPDPEDRSQIYLPNSDRKCLYLLGVTDTLTDAEQYLEQIDSTKDQNLLNLSFAGFRRTSNENLN